MGKFIGLIIILSLAGPVVFAVEDYVNHGTVIILNGTSSCGKTTIVKTLQEQSNDLYTVVMLDEFVKGYALKNSLPAWMSRRELQHKVLCALFSHVKILADQGVNVLVDVVDYDEYYEEYDSILRANHVIKVLVYCPFDSLVERIEKRNNCGDVTEYRPLNLSCGQFVSMYKLQECSDEMYVDGIPTDRIKWVLSLVEQEVRHLIEEGTIDRITCEKNLQNFISYFGEIFKLDTCDKIIISPRHRWDFVVNTQRESLSEIISTINEYIRMNKATIEDD